MAFHHRKLLNESAIFDQKHEYCESMCDSSTNPERICSPQCVGFCPPDCKLVNIEISLPPLPPPPPPPPPPSLPVLHKAHALSLSLTVSLSVLAACFFLFTCYTIYRFCSYWKRRPPQLPRPEDDVGPDDFFDEEHGPVVDHPIWYIRTIGLQPSVISAITIVKYKRGEGLIEGTDCSVCLNEFEEDETLRLLPKCNHAFHIPCIDTWLRSHTNCPMCRAGIVNNIAAMIESQEPVVHNSGQTEENRSEISGTDRDSGNESPEIRPGIDDHRISRGESGVKINEEDRGGLVAMRRSVSLDSLSASMISAAIANASHRNSDIQLVLVKDSAGEDVGLNRSNSIERCEQSEGTSSMKRSVSCSAKVLLSRHSSRSRSSQ